MDTLLQLLHSDGADKLWLLVGQPPVIVLDGEPQPIDGPALTANDTERLLHNITDTRQRRDLRDHGRVEFIYNFRDRAKFVICAKMDHGNVQIYAH
jgi:twitching motility protein PilT